MCISSKTLQLYGLTSISCSCRQRQTTSTCWLAGSTSFYMCQNLFHRRTKNHSFLATSCSAEQTLTVPCGFCFSKANDGFLNMYSKNSQPKGLFLYDEHLFWKSLELWFIQFVLALIPLWVLLNQFAIWLCYYDQIGLYNPMHTYTPPLFMTHVPIPLWCCNCLI